MSLQFLRKKWFITFILFLKYRCAVHSYKPKRRSDVYPNMPPVVLFYLSRERRLILSSTSIHPWIFELPGSSLLRYRDYSDLDECAKRQSTDISRRSFRRSSNCCRSSHRQQ